MNTNTFEYIEHKYALAGLSPRQKGVKLLGILKREPWYRIPNWAVRHDRETAYLLSDNCDLDISDRNVILYEMARIGSRVSVDPDIYKYAMEAFERWGITDIMKTYIKDHDNQKVKDWFAQHDIPITCVRRILANANIPYRFFETYPELKPLRGKSDTEYTPIQDIGKEKKLLYQTLELIQQGDFDISKYDLIKTLNGGRVRDAFYSDFYDKPEELSLEKLLESAMNEQLGLIKTKNKLIQFLDLLDALVYAGNYSLSPEHIIFGFHMYELVGNREIDKYFGDQSGKVYNLLGITKEETDLHNFDLKYTKDISRAKEILPLALKYRFLFERGWYTNGPYVTTEPQFSGDYNNALEKKRKEMNWDLRKKSSNAKQFKRGLIKVATTIVPEKLGSKVEQLEHTVAQILHNKKRPGRR